MSFLTKLWEFWHNAHTYAIRYAESGDVWKNCKPPHIIKSKWERYLKLFTLDTYKRMSHNGSLNRNKEAHSSIIKHIKGSLFFINHAKHLVRAYLFLSFFLQNGSYYLWKGLSTDLFYSLHNLDTSLLWWSFIWKHIYIGRIYRNGCNNFSIVGLRCLL